MNQILNWMVRSLDQPENPDLKSVKRISEGSLLIVTRGRLGQPDHRFFVIVEELPDDLTVL